MPKLDMNETILSLCREGVADPRLVVEAIIDKHGEVAVRSWASANARDLLVHYAREYVAKSFRVHGEIAQPQTRLQKAGLDGLDRPIWVDDETGWKPLGDLTANDCLRRAAYHDKIATSHHQQGETFRRYAAAIREHQVEMVRDLPVPTDELQRAADLVAA